MPYRNGVLVIYSRRKYYCYHKNTNIAIDIGLFSIAAPCKVITLNA